MIDRDLNRAARTFARLARAKVLALLCAAVSLCPLARAVAQEQEQSAEAQQRRAQAQGRPTQSQASPAQAEEHRVLGELQGADSARARASALCARAESSAASGHYAEAARLYEEALVIDPDHGDARVALGWARYRLGDFTGAAAAFGKAAEGWPQRADVWTGLGYARMQTGDSAGSQAAFDRALALSPQDTDILKGIAFLDLRRGRGADAVALLRRVVEKTPQDEDARAALRRALAESGQFVDRRLRPTLLDLLPAPVTPPILSVPFRAGMKYLEVKRGGSWQPVFLKGVNLGVALPGRFPSEFPEDETLYRDWLGKIRAMNANVVRLYTLLPPAFYGALAKENQAHPQAPLWLVQGIWVELPPDDDFSDPAWNADYAAELRRVIDVLHGNIDVAPRPGHASGLYETDVSAWVLGFILGREWEPFSVKAYDERKGKDNGAVPCAFAGRYVRVAAGSPAECWIASTLETAAAHLAEAYAESRPMAFTNWPTLDPLHHPTESTREEEDALLRKRGIKDLPKRGPVYDNDAVQVDVNRMVPTDRLPGGIFASYHVYPYYPDFMILDPGYIAARDRDGPNAYFGYLQDLLRYHAGRPVLISETGVPTSRGVAHRQPQGFNHGGHDEREQARIDARLARSTHEAGCAGVIAFAWLDEWFKHSWLFWDVTIPAERKPLWLNALDPEQNFGILAADPGPAGGGVVLDGRTDDWAGVAPVYPPRKGKIRALYATSDEAYLYLRLDVEPRSRDKGGAGEGSFGGWTYWIGIDTYDRARGDTRLPGLKGKLNVPSGLEFAIRLDGVDPRILVDAPYDIGTHGLAGPYASVPNEDGLFIPMVVEIRLERVGRDGTIFPAETNDMSPLRRGTTDPANPRYDSLSDFFYDPAAGLFEIRVPWGLLGVTDPSARRVLHQTTIHPPVFDTTITEGFVFYAAAVPPGKVRPAAERPAGREKGPVFTWKSWDLPSYHLRPKAVYDSLTKTYGELTVPTVPVPSAPSGP